MNQAHEHRQHLLIEAIARAQALFIHSDDNHTVFDGLLADLLNLAESEYGFIGEVLSTDEGQPYLKTHAITNIAWNVETRKFYAENAPDGLEFFNLKSLFGSVMTSKQPVIANTPASDPRSGGLPEGHPPLNAFLGVPIFMGDEMLAMVGISNRQGGYQQSLIDFLQPLLTTIGQLIQAKRNQYIRLQAEQDLRQREKLLTRLSRQVVRPAPR